MKTRIILVSISDPAVYGNPLSLGYLKTYSDSALKGSVSSEILELSLDPCLKAPDSAAAAIAKKKPDIVGFSCYLWNITAVISVSKALRRTGSAARIVLGGPEATGRGASALKDSKADILVNGEGEHTFVELLERFQSGREWAGTPGTTMLRRGKALQGPRRERIADLDSIPSPYLAGLFDGRWYRHLVYETARGCPHRCIYCNWSYRDGIRYFSMERAMAEAAWMAKRAPARPGGPAGLPEGYVFVADNDITMNAERGCALLSHIGRLSGKSRLTWMVNCRLEHWTEKKARAGNFSCFEFYFGVQSVNPEVLRSVGRVPFSRGELSKNLAALKRFSPKARVYFQIMLGLPGDSARSFMESLRWCLEACAAIQPGPALVYTQGRPIPAELADRGLDRPIRAGVNVFHTSILPGSRLEKEGRKLGIRWDSKPPYLVRGTKEMDKREFSWCQETLLTLEGYMRRLCPASALKLTSFPVQPSDGKVSRNLRRLRPPVKRNA